jgi:hypothetical protein
VNKVTKVKQVIRRGRLALGVTEVVIGTLVVTGCGSGTSVAAQAQQLIQHYPWLSRLAFSFLEGLVGALGWNIGMLLSAAAAVLLGT